MGEQTELALFHWRYGPAQAERLAGGILELEGFESIDPQCPLGGPDGLKDFLCRRHGELFVAATFFPPTQQSFKDVQEKFLHDLAGVERNAAAGIVFITNQPLTPGERNTLAGQAGEADVHLFHLERVRLLLDSPRGYGLRLQYLRVEMTIEDQISFFTNWNDNQARTFNSFSRAVHELTVRVDTLATTMAREPTPLHRQTISDGRLEFSGRAAKPTEPIVSGNLSLPLLCAVHRALAPAGESRGQLRKVRVWIGSPGTAPEKARFTPPPPEQVAQLTNDLLSDWNSNYPTVCDTADDERISAIVAFHHRFLTIHPFPDGNGRIARFLLAVQFEELCKRSFAGERLPPADYALALVEADRGNLADLKRLFLSFTEPIV